MFFICVASKGLSVYVSGLESTLAGISISVDSKWVSEEMPGQLSSWKGRTLADRRAIGKHRNLQRREFKLLGGIAREADYFTAPIYNKIIMLSKQTQRSI